MTLFLRFLAILCDVLSIAILIRVILSWILPGRTGMLTNILYQVTEPVMAPLRRIIPRAGMLDFSPVVAVILLQIIAAFLY